VQKVGFASGAYKPGLDGMRRWDAVLGHPWQQYGCIHVAGTNGKGSVSSMIASALAFPDDTITALQHTAERTGLRGRWEHLSWDPEIICDIGHNPAALSINFKRLSDLDRPLIIVYAVMRDKDLAGIVPLMPDNAHYIFSAPDIARAMPAQQVYDTVKSLRPNLDCEVIARIPDAIDRAIELCSTVADRSGLKACPPPDMGRDTSSKIKIGLYTSPHLVDFRERMKVVTEKGWYMPDKEWVWDFLLEHEKDIEDLSFFEITTGMAFKWFAEQKVDKAVIEVGLGGRLDSTNIITPELSIITSIGLDHCAMLGDTRAKIAAEKAGIFKPGVPAIVGGLSPDGLGASQDTETAPVFKDIAADNELTFTDLAAINIDEEALATTMDLRGPYQAINLHTSLVALKALREPCGAKTGIGFFRPDEKNNSSGAASHLDTLIYLGGSAFAVAEAIPYIEQKVK